MIGAITDHCMVGKMKVKYDVNVNELESIEINEIKDHSLDNFMGFMSRLNWFIWSSTTLYSFHLSNSSIISQLHQLQIHLHLHLILHFHLHLYILTYIEEITRDLHQSPSGAVYLSGVNSILSISLVKMEFSRRNFFS